MPSETCGPECSTCASYGQICNEERARESIAQWQRFTSRPVPTWIIPDEYSKYQVRLKCQGTCGAVLCKDCMEDVKKVLSF